MYTNIGTSKLITDYK